MIRSVTDDLIFDTTWDLEFIFYGSSGTTSQGRWVKIYTIGEIYVIDR